jgi:hypothetical protein
MADGTTSAEAIAAGLTEAQREMLFGLPDDQSWLHSYSHIARIEKRFGGNSLCGFEKTGLIAGRYERLGMWHRLTPLGLAVRQILQRSPDQ